MCSGDPKSTLAVFFLSIFIQILEFWNRDNFFRPHMVFIRFFGDGTLSEKPGKKLIWILGAPNIGVFMDLFILSGRVPPTPASSPAQAPKSPARMGGSTSQI